jgi:outer membrane biogenesis lipoprotein LolB
VKRRISATIIMAMLALAACTSTAKHPTSTTAGVSKGAGNQNAAADVALG